MALISNGEQNEFFPFWVFYKRNVVNYLIIIIIVLKKLAHI